MHHKEKCPALPSDTGSSLPSKLNKLCPCLEKLQKHRTALLINPDEPDVRERSAASTALMKTQSIRHSRSEVQMFDIILRRD